MILSSIFYKVESSAVEKKCYVDIVSIKGSYAVELFVGLILKELYKLQNGSLLHPNYFQGFYFFGGDFVSRVYDYFFLLTKRKEKKKKQKEKM